MNAEFGKDGATLPFNARRRVMRMRLYKILSSLFFRLTLTGKTLTIRFRYDYNLLRIRKNCPGRKIRVAFLVNELAKWKAQSLYDLMDASDRYEPFIVMTIADRDWSLSDDKMFEKYSSGKAYFEGRHMKVVDGYDFALKRVVPVPDFESDIVWYQQPWCYAEEQRPDVASIWTLTCYIPYFVVNYGNRDMDYGQQFHRDLWRHFILNRDWERVYGKTGHWWSYAGRLLGLGHTGLDYIVNRRDELRHSDYVVYAPHWSIDCPGNENDENYSTFLWTGRTMLEYAKAHRQVRWVFKPHPTLRKALHASGAWTDEEIGSYYKGWEDVGTACYTGDYQELFLHSKAMVTDCGSFLTEYFATGKPLIHLLSPAVKFSPHKLSSKMFDSFYKVSQLEELPEVLDQIVIEGKDPKCREREKVLREMDFGTRSAAQNILDYLDSIFNIK